MRGPTRSHKGVGVKKKQLDESILYSLDRPAGEISRPVVFWRLRRARRADIRRDAVCTTMRPRSRSQDPRERRRRDRAARGMPTPSSAARPACWSYLVTAYSDGFTPSVRRSCGICSPQLADAQRRGALPDRMLRFKSRVRDDTSEAIHQ